jgi:hypothetical protein
MNLREELLKEHSKANCERIVAWVGADQKRFDELFSIFTLNEYRLVQLSAWPVSYCVQQHPELIKKHFPKLIKNVQRTDVHNAVKRNTVRLLQHVAIPEKYQGEVMNLCFEFIQSHTEKVAVKAFALTVLENLSKSYPEIIPEVTLIIEEQMPHETAAFKSRGLRFIKNTSKIVKG